MLEHTVASSMVCLICTDTVQSDTKHCNLKLQVEIQQRCFKKESYIAVFIHHGPKN